MKKIYKIIDSEAGNIIENGLTKKEAESLIQKYEDEDKYNGHYEETFYEIEEEV